MWCPGVAGWLAVLLGLWGSLERGRRRHKSSSGATQGGQITALDLSDMLRRFFDWERRVKVPLAGRRTPWLIALRDVFLRRRAADGHRGLGGVEPGRALASPIARSCPKPDQVPLRPRLCLNIAP